MITRGVTIREGPLAIHGRWYRIGAGRELEPTISFTDEFRNKYGLQAVCSDAMQARVRRIYICSVDLKAGLSRGRKSTEMT